MSCSANTKPKFASGPHFIDNEGQLRIKIYDKGIDFDFPIVNFPFPSNNIPASAAYFAFVLN